MLRKSSTSSKERQSTSLEIERFVERLVDYSNGDVTVVLFGSRARGDYDEESDIDVLIVGEVDFDGLMDFLIEVLLKYGGLVGPIVIKPEDLKRRSNGFIKTVMNEGKSLYSSTSTP